MIWHYIFATHIVRAEHDILGKGVAGVAIEF